jgi:hypothetical protein
MFYLIIPPALFALVVIIYLALSRKSGFRTRIAALAALGLMFLSVIVCGIFLISGGLAAEGNVLIPLDLPADKAAAPSNNLWIFLVFIFFLAALFVVITALSIREQRRLRNEKNTSGSQAA